MYLKEIDTVDMECAFELYQIPDYVLETVPEDCRGDITGAVYDVSSGELGDVYLTESSMPYDNYAQYHEPSYWQPDVPAVLNDAQKVVLQQYAGGEFAHLCNVETEQELKQGLEDCGDGLLRFLMVEVSSSEDCNSLQEAQQRIENATRDLQTAADTIYAVEVKAEDSSLSFGERGAGIRVAKTSDDELKEVQRLVLAAIQAMVNKDDLAVMCATCTAVNLSKEWATEVLQHYPCTLLVEDNYQDDDLFSAALCQIIDGFEYPNHSHQTVEEVLKEYGV